MRQERIKDQVRTASLPLPLTSDCALSGPESVAPSSLLTGGVSPLRQGLHYNVIEMVLSRRCQRVNSATLPVIHGFYVVYLVFPHHTS